MTFLIYLGIGIATFFFMEWVAWATHKYVMHGFLWIWHKDHHEPHDNVFEKNDYFALVFSVPSALTIVLGSEVSVLWFLFPMGFGILGYGIFYVLFHDIIVHRRVKASKFIKFVSQSKYMRRMIRAHRVHHSKQTKKDCEAFGFLYAPKKYEV